MMTPENYRLFKNRCRELINRIDIYVEGKTMDGLIRPMDFLKETQNLSNEISETIGKCEMLMKNVKTDDIKQQYQEILYELCACRERLLARH